MDKAETYKNKWLIGIGIVVIVGLIALFLFKNKGRQESQDMLATTTDDGSEGLGAELYGKVEGQGQISVPAPSPVPNPVDNLYKNPFE